MRPLDFLGSIKTKLGVVIVAAVGVTVIVIALGTKTGIPVWILSVAAAILALAMVQFLARGMTSPLREMVTAAKAMAKGDYSRRVTATSNDEVGQLATAFNRMAADLAEVDRMRRDLVANVSHELRTPISALQAVLENLVDEVERPDPVVLRTMLGQVERLGGLVGQLLDLSRLESGAIPLRSRTFSVAELLHTAADESRLQPRGANGEVAVEVAVEPVDLEVFGDPERVHQVVANLLDNAIAHSPPGGRVRLAGSRNGGVARIEVRDEGPGIPSDEAARVFERFYRSDSARSSREGSSGLGLAIARWIIDLHGGDIRVDTTYSQGCNMVVELPRSA
jgi:signal transduction histidine kinase